MTLLYSQESVLKDTIHWNFQSISIFQESDSRPLSLADEEQLLLYCNQSGVLFIPTNVYFKLYGTSYINERNYKFYICC